jgi:anaerobic selenocysteine-containing dehydrogenase
LHLKRKSFEHEREYRLTTTLERKDNKAPGKYIPISLEEMIEEVHVSPTAPDWIVEVVQKEVSNHKLEVEVLKSDLYGPVK